MFVDVGPLHAYRSIRSGIGFAPLERDCWYTVFYKHVAPTGACVVSNARRLTNISLLRERYSGRELEIVSIPDPNHTKSQTKNCLDERILTLPYSSAIMMRI